MQELKQAVVILSEVPANARHSLGHVTLP